MVSFVVRFLLPVSVLLALAVAAPAQAASCRGCEVFGQTCTINCLGMEAEADVRACLLACDSAASACSGDESVTLSSEDAVRLGLAEGPSGLTGACHPTTPCPQEYSSCASWSSYSNCDEPFCGTFKFCGDPPSCHEPDICFGPALRQRQERFRACFNSSGQPCTEYQQTVHPMPVGMACGC